MCPKPITPNPPPRQACNSRAVDLMHRQQRRLSGGSASGSASSLKTPRLTKPHQSLFQTPVEYWHELNGKWHAATFTVNKIKNGRGKSYVAYIDVPDNHNLIITVEVDFTLRVEHSDPLMRDFHLLLVQQAPNSSYENRHRIAVFSERQAEDILSLLLRYGAVIVRRDRLAAPQSGTEQFFVRSRNPSRTRSRLRPISEGSVYEGIFDRKANDVKNDEVFEGARMGMQSRETVKVSRRKSTGSESESLVQRRPVSELIRTSSMNSRGVNPNHPSLNSVMLEKIKVSPTKPSAVWYCDDAEDRTNSGRGDVGLERSKRWSKDESDGAGMRKFQGDPIGGTWPRRRKVHEEEDNEKLEKYKFLLVNIEEDPDILDPACFDGCDDIVRFEFTDYPSEVFTPDPSDHVAKHVTPNWIRKSYEELNLDHQRISPAARHPLRASVVSKSLGDLAVYTSIREEDSDSDDTIADDTITDDTIMDDTSVSSVSSVSISVRDSSSVLQDKQSAFPIAIDELYPESQI